MAGVASVAGAAPSAALCAVARSAIAASILAFCASRSFASACVAGPRGVVFAGVFSGSQASNFDAAS